MLLPLSTYRWNQNHFFDADVSNAQGQNVFSHLPNKTVIIEEMYHQNGQAEYLNERNSEDLFLYDVSYVPE